MQLPTRGVTTYVTVCANLVRLSRLPITIVGESVADTPPVTVPVNVGALQLYTLPLVPLDGVTSNPTPLQVTLVIADTSGIGFSVTINENASPTQLPDIGVTE